MRNYLTVALIVFYVVSFSANRYWVGGNATWDATAGTKWATTSGGAGGSAVPTSSDDVFLDNGAGTGNVTMGTGYTAACKSLDCTGYVGTLSGSGNITVTTGGTGNVTLVAGMTITCTGTLTVNGTSTLTSNGKTWTGNFTVSSGTSTHTLADDWTVDGNVSIVSANFTGGTTLNYKGNMTSVQTNAGGVLLKYIGTGGNTFQIGGSLGCRNDVTFAGSGTMAIQNGGTFGNATMTHTSGTVTHTGTLTLGTVTMNVSTITFANITTSNNVTVTLTSDLNISGNLSPIGTNNATINGLFNVNVGGNLDYSPLTTNTLTGTATIVMNGTGFIKSPTTTGYLGINITINTAGTITLTNTVYFGGGKTLTIDAVGTLASSSGVLYTRNTSATITVEVASTTFPFSIETGIATTFNGTYGFTVGSFTCNVAGVVNSFKSGNTYTITSALTLIGTLASRVQVNGITASSYTNFILQMGATQTVVYVSATDVDSSLGQTIWNSQGVHLRTLNWNLLTAPRTVGYVN